jgi:iron complex outermembrane receptor protein
MGFGKLAAALPCAVVTLIGPSVRAESAPVEPPRQVETIVVTAEKRDENLQSAAVAAVVMNEEMLSRNSVNEIDDLEFTTPSLTIATAGQSNQMNLRGIGKFDSGGTSTSAVATYRDGVGTVSGFFNQEPYYDIETVEVLRGPQGTYVGENAAGGAIFVNTRDPALGASDGFVQAGYGNYDAVELTGAVNVPLADNLAVRIAGNRVTRDSFYDVFIDTGATIKNSADPGEIDYNSVRIGVLWKPTDPLDVLFKLDYNNLDHGGHVYGNVPGFPTPTGPLTGAPYGNISSDLYTVGNNFEGVLAKDRMARGILEFDYAFDGGYALKWVSGAQYINTHIRNDDDGSVDADVRQHIRPVFRVYTSEATLLSPDDQAIRWLFGAFYRLEDLEFPTDDGFIIFDGLPNPTPVQGLSIQWDTPRRTTAAYGQIAFDLTDRLELQTGMRIQSYDMEQDALLLLGGAPFLPREDDYDEVTFNYKVALNWQATDDHYFYAFVATGNTTGGNSVVAGVPSFHNQKSTDYEIGWKGTLFDGQVLTQIGGFYTLIEDYQASFAAVIDPGPPLLLSSTFQNLDGDTKTWGVEAQAQTQFGNFGLDFTAAWIHSELGDDLIFDTTLARFLETGGKQIPWCPEYTFNVGVQYTFNLGGDITLTPRVTYSWIDDQTVTATDRVVNGVEIDRIFDHDLVNAQLNLTAGQWRAQAYVTNWDEEEYIQAHSGAPTHPDAYANEPRRYGLRVTYDFGAE